MWAVTSPEGPFGDHTGYYNEVEKFPVFTVQCITHRSKPIYHSTYTGSYVMTNDAGQQIIGEGQFGFVKDANSTPQILPGDPGLNLKDLPFTLGVGSGPLRGSSAQECVVR